MIGKICTYAAALGTSQAAPIASPPVDLIRDNVSNAWWDDRWRHHAYTAAHTRFGRAVTVHCFLNAENFFASYFELRMSVTHWLSFTATDDVVAVALIVTLLVLGILFVSMFLADKFGR